MQTNKLDKHKAWGSLWTPTKEATIESPENKKVKNDKTADQPNLWKISFVPQMIDFIKFHHQGYIPSPSIVLDTFFCLTLMVMPSHDQLLFDQVGGSIMCFSFLNVFYVSLNWQVVFSQNIGN
jgi:hypothetical protein